MPDINWLLQNILYVYIILAKSSSLFFVTIFVTLAEDLVLGIAVRLFIEIFIYSLKGTSLKNIFKARYQEKQLDNNVVIEIEDAAQFSHFIGFKKVLDKTAEKAHLIVDFSNATLFDYSFMSFRTYFKEEFESRGRIVELINLEKLTPVSERA